MSEHTIEFRVYYEDTDAGGIVYHARYLAFAERARTEAIRAMGMPVSELLRDYDLVFVVREARLTYRTPLRLDDILCVTTRLLRLGAASCVLGQTVTREGVVSAEIEVGLACVRASDGYPARFPPNWRDLLQKLAVKD
jgi:acyl-CoA thioester hydrolase